MRPPQPDPPRRAVLAVLGGLLLLTAGALGLALAMFIALFAGIPVGSFLGPETAGEQARGLAFGIGLGVLAGATFAAGLACMVRGFAGRWPSGNAILLGPPVAGFVITVAAAQFGASQ